MILRKYISIVLMFIVQANIEDRMIPIDDLAEAARLWDYVGFVEWKTWTAEHVFQDKMYKMPESKIFWFSIA